MASDAINYPFLSCPRLIPRTQNLNFVDQPPDRYGGDHGSHPLWLPQHLRDSVLVSEQHLIAEVLVFLHGNEVVQRVKA
jgi:hypothetical protein